MYTVEKLQQIGKLLHDTLSLEGINVWYGDPGSDEKVAIMILQDVPLKEIRQYIREQYGEADYEEEVA